MTRPANENPKLKGSPFYDTLYRDIDIAIPEDDRHRSVPVHPEIHHGPGQGAANADVPLLIHTSNLPGASRPLLPDDHGARSRDRQTAG